MFAVIFIPDFALQAVLRHAPELRDRPVALLDANSPGPTVLQATAPAKKAGVLPGLTPSQAQARCPGLEIKISQPIDEAAATTILLQTAYAFSPNLEATKPGVCTLELKGLGLDAPGALHLWAEKIRQALRALFFEAQIGVGPTPGMALLAAHRVAAPDAAAESTLLAPGTGAAPPISIVEDAAGFVAQLPIAALSPTPEILEILRRWGIRTVGEFLALGRAEIAERLGPEALKLFAQVSPTARRPLKRISPPEQFLEQREFEQEIETMEPLLFWLRSFTEHLSRRLEAIHLVIAQLHLRLGLASGDQYERTFKVPAPTGNVDVLFRMLHTHLETLRTDSPIALLQLAATPAKPEMHQFGLFQNTLRNPNQFAETFARLTALVGPESAGIPVVETTHRPDSVRLHPPNFEFVPHRNFPDQAEGDGLQFRRFRPPLPAQLEFHHQQPAHVRSSRFTGAVTGVRGPFLASGNWWDSSRWAREEWDVEIGGALLRLFRSGDGCFVEGVYD
jgi:protein ImuB